MHPVRSIVLALAFLGCSSSSDAPADPSGSADGTDPVDSGSGPSEDQPGGLARAEDPVVVLGAQLSGLGGVAAGDVVAFARRNGSWEAVPVQVDERLVQDFCEIYGKSSGRWGTEPACKTNKVVTALFYADAETFTGADPDPGVDLDDEVVFMARDAGDRVGTWSEPDGVVPGSGLELSLTDGEDEAWIYLFVRQGDSLEPAAGRDYVQYTLSLDGIDYKTEYDLYGYGCGGTDATCNPSMTEDTTVEGASYSRHFAARWVTDELRLTAGDATGVDILDLHQSRFGPDNCGRHVLTYSTAEGAFVANRDGPVRAIRSYLGANSGPLTQRDHLFYDRREDIVTQLRVHATSAGIMDLLDYSDAAVGMTYTNDLNPDGLVLDGTPETATEAGIPQWEVLTGPQGTLVSTGTIDASFEVSTARFFWADDASPSFPQCNTSTTLAVPDDKALGMSGVWLDGALPDTDPKNGSTAYTLTRRILYYREPGLSQDAALALVAGAQRPVDVRVRPAGGSPDAAACGDGTCEEGEETSCAMDCLPVDRTCGDTVCLPPENSTSCPGDCAFDSDDPGDGTDDCGDGTCDPSVENELSCAADCWPEFSDEIACANAACGGAVDACADEPGCVDLVLCVAACVADGGGASSCINDCAVETGASNFERTSATDLLVCGNSNGCF